MTEPLTTIESFTRNRSVVLAAALVAMLVAGVLGWWSIAAMTRQADGMNLLPIRAVTFVSPAGELKRVDGGELKRIAGAIQNMGGSMLRTDLNQVRSAVRQVKWVRDAEVRRRFPATLEVQIEEHTPFARWQIAGSDETNLLVNTYGDVFAAEVDEPAKAMPVLSGPRDSAREVLANYQAFATQLTAIGKRPAEVRLSARRAWQLKVEGGSTLELGRNDAEQRLGRYVRAYAGIAALRATSSRIDLRYPNGFAVRVAMAKLAAETAKPSTKKAAIKS